MDRWRLHYPPGPRAGADAYATYLEAVHPWPLALVPRTVDVGALVELGRGTSPQRI